MKKGSTAQCVCLVDESGNWTMRPCLSSAVKLHPKEEIHELLLSFAEAGATVVRLKGGDPLVFGRGGEEMDFLQKQGIQVQVIPAKVWHTRTGCTEKGSND